MHQRRAPRLRSLGFSESLPSHRRDARTSICGLVEKRFRARLQVPLVERTDIHDANDRVAFVRPRRVREKNFFPHTGDAAGFTEWHMPLVPATIVKRNAVMWNSWSRGRRFFWHWNPLHSFSRPEESEEQCRSLSAFKWRAAPGSNRHLPKANFERFAS